ncbi:fumarylacetoacetate hydrolase family protein [Liquorilactobacillus satsumensis]|uniref:2-keto-4-pentenoate hydratase n=2 Tax=Lactobacillaceae TaxID=33958 RepID=UPI0021C3244A|nr:2-keto-4-pentenoate hydratase [Liquorilactobacillus satsumensis]MCP9313760.1 fumarylacetoacetate hydrolase family protein [Liquorilactobacillus satsumensis]MCP9360901.1 fumarylacetoacetate hydrolase family protein [Liquorilactobacillus satsumensis]
MNKQEMAQYLLSAYRKGTVNPLTEKEPDLSLTTAYQVQLEIVQHYLNQGHQITGKKIGLTSKAMQKSIGVNEPDYGHLFDFMQVSNQGTVPTKLVLQPRVEGEIAFVLKKTLSKDNLTARDIIEATDYVVPAIEIVDSRITNWKLTLADTISDNGSSGAYVLGDIHYAIDEFDLAAEKMTLYKNGQAINSGKGADCLDNPINAVVWLANKLASLKIPLRAGEVILSGALSAAIPAQAGDHFEMRYDHFDSVSINF